MPRQNVSMGGIAVPPSFWSNNRYYLKMKVKDIQTDGTILDVIPSDNGENVYTIRWDRKTGYTCECIGFNTTKKQCKHIKRFIFKTQVDSLLTEHLPFAERTAVVLRIIAAALEIWKGKI